MSTVEDPETTGEADLADLLPTGSIEPQVAEADPLDLLPTGSIEPQVAEASEPAAAQPVADEASEPAADPPVAHEAELFDQDAEPDRRAPTSGPAAGASSTPNRATKTRAAKTCWPVPPR